MNYLIWKGEDSRDIKGLIISELPSISKPQMRVTETTIDGIDGSIIEELGYSSYDKSVNIGLTQNADIDEITHFFSGSGEVVFSNEEDKYYKANIINQIDFVRLVRYKTATVVFRVQPYKYYLNEECVTVGEITTAKEPLITNGIYNDGTSVETSPDGDGWETITRFVEVKELQEYTLEGLLTKSTWQTSVYFYDEEQALIEEKDISHNNYVFTFTTPSGTRYLKFCGYSQVIDISTVSLYGATEKNVYPVLNIGNVASKPLIHLTGKGNIVCQQNGLTVFTYNFPENETEIYIDSEKQDAYLGEVLKNRNMQGEFPTFQTGETSITFDGDITSVEIYARSRWI